VSRPAHTCSLHSLCTARRCTCLSRCCLLLDPSFGLRPRSLTPEPPINQTKRALQPTFFLILSLLLPQTTPLSRSLSHLGLLNQLEEGDALDCCRLNFAFVPSFDWRSLRVCAKLPSLPAYHTVLQRPSFASRFIAPIAPSSSYET
jgi:hypothetical protein